MVLDLRRLKRGKELKKNILGIIGSVSILSVSNVVIGQEYSFTGKIANIHHRADTIRVRLSNENQSFEQKVYRSASTFVFPSLPKGIYTLSFLYRSQLLDTTPIVIDKNWEQTFSLHYTDTLRTIVVKSFKHSTKKKDDLISLDNVTNAKQLVSARQIELIGSTRLDDIMKLQNGVAVVNNLGAGNRSVGIQMQGFSSEYIKILQDGLPLTGRNDGNFDLSRYNVANIDHIEIIKGAASTLYGADAIGGVVNIVTKQQPNAQWRLFGQGGSFNTQNVNLNYTTPMKQNQGFLLLNGDYYHTGGFNVNQQYQEYGQTCPPYTSGTFQGRLSIPLNTNNQLNISTRFADRTSHMYRNYGGGSQGSNDYLKEVDFNVLTSWTHQFSDQSQLLIRHFATHYYTRQNVDLEGQTNSVQNFRFGEWDQRGELQFKWNAKNHIWNTISGGGSEWQSLKAYDGVSGGNQRNDFAYTQWQWKPSEKWNTTAGVRWTHNTLYGSKWTPTAGLQWRPIENLVIAPSIGMGFKSPTFDQMSQVFTNLAQGYTVVGANVIDQALAKLDSAGQISNLWPIAKNVKPLKAETSTSLNLDVQWHWNSLIKLEVNGFYHHIRNMIFTQQIGQKYNGGQIFSYFNLNKVINKGAEFYLTLQPIKSLKLNVNYQLLYVQDQSILDSIKAGKLTVRGDQIRTAKKSDYFNLPNRSRNMWQFQLLYDCPQKTSWSGFFNANYRGKYGFMDLDNNGFIDPYDVYVKGFWLLSTTIEKRFLKKKNLVARATLDNILNKTNYLMPFQPGRNVKIGLSYTF